MKKFNIFKQAGIRRIAGIIALAAVIGFSFGACKDPDPEGDPALTGTITITPATAAVNTELSATYSGTETVTYQWKKDGNNVGTATTTKPNKYTPTTAGSYTVTVSATGFQSKTSAAVTVTAGGGGTGPLNITGFDSKYNGKWVIAQGEFGEDPDEIMLVATSEFDETTGIIKGAQISGGSVTLNVWEMDEDMRISEFTGSGEASFGVYILNTETFDPENGELEGIMIGNGGVTVTFTNGTGSGTISSIEEIHVITINGMDALNGEQAFICLHTDIIDIDWDSDNYYGGSGYVKDNGSLTVTLSDNGGDNWWDGNGSYQIGVFLWEDQDASEDAIYYYTNGAALNTSDLPNYDFDGAYYTVFNFNKFKKDE